MGLWVSFFFWFWQKKQSGVSKQYLNLQRKNVKKNSWTIGFSSFLDFHKKNLCFYRNVFGRVVKTTFYVSRGKLSEHHFWNEVLKTSGLSDNFWSFRDNGGKIFQGWQKSKRCPGEQPKEKVFYKEKIRFFSDSERLSYFWRKTLPDLRNPQSENAMK